MAAARGHTGALTIRPFWPRYVTRETEAVIWVVDAGDAARVEESRAALCGLLEREMLLLGLPLLVLLNKATHSL